MFTDPRAPLIVGALMILLLGGSLVMYYPLPGKLSQSHGSIEGLTKLENCTSCHHEEGITQGCLTCHEEIANQLESEDGYHHFLLEFKTVECARCHPEHNGGQFQLVNQLSWEGLAPRLFRHPHVKFRLEGRHLRLTCEDCHFKKLAEPFHLRQFPEVMRPRSFLGLTQDCVACHEDIHSDGLSGACSRCHGQESFIPPTQFDHADHFPLDGGHERVECDGCHIFPEGADVDHDLTFQTARGGLCRECHDTPHHTLGEGCQACHLRSEPLWAAAKAGFTSDLHALTSFRLTGPHAAVECEKCHEPSLKIEERYQSPSAPDYRRTLETCDGCHGDPHEGQFVARHEKCLDCHRKGGFTPHRFGLGQHALVYPLTGAHEAALCESCHEDNVPGHLNVRKFSGTSTQCKACHDDPHGGQFRKELDEQDCTACHNDLADTFTIAPFDHEKRTGYALTGAHVHAECQHCHHVPEEPGRVIASDPVRLYRDTPTNCAGCHKDVHRGQFRENGVTVCEPCHTTSSRWREVQFDHNTQARFALDGAHAGVPCGRCHVPVKLPDGAQIIQYKPIGSRCKDCHDIVPR